MFLGKVAALAAQLVVLELVLGAGVVVLYGTKFGLLVASALAATLGLASAGSLYGALAAGARVRGPPSAPVSPGHGARSHRRHPVVNRRWRGRPGGWPWCGLLAAVAVVQTVVGAVAFGPLLEDT